MGKIKVMVADDIEETRNVIKKIINMEDESFQFAGEAANGEEVLELIPKYKPDVILMDINMPKMNGLEATDIITEKYPSIIVIIMSVQGESEYLKRAMFSGAKEYIVKPFNYQVLTSTINVTYTKHKTMMMNQYSHNQSEKDAKIITFYSSKGGVGKTVLSLNSAIVMSKEYKKKVLLLDLDLQYGDISMLVNQHTEKTILDMIDDDQYDSYENMKNYLFGYNENLDILFGPRNPESAEYINKESIENIIKKMKNRYDVIIVDTSVNFSDTTLYVLDTSDLILFVSTMEISSLKNTKLGIEVMKSLNYESDKVKLIINSATSKYGVNEKDISTVFNKYLLWMISEDIKTVTLSINKGKPFCDEDKNNNLKIVKHIKNMCKQLVNDKA